MVLYIFCNLAIAGLTFYLGWEVIPNRVFAFVLSMFVVSSIHYWASHCQNPRFAAVSDATLSGILLASVVVLLRNTQLGISSTPTPSPVASGLYTAMALWCAIILLNAAIQEMNRIEYPVLLRGKRRLTATLLVLTALCTSLGVAYLSYERVGLGLAFWPSIEEVRYPPGID